MCENSGFVPHQDLEWVELSKEEGSDLDNGKVQVKFLGEAEPKTFDFVILCTGYKSSLEAQACLSCNDVMARAHFVGLGPEPKDLLPLKGIGREAQSVARHISDLLHLKRRKEQRLKDEKVQLSETDDMTVRSSKVIGGGLTTYLFQIFLSLAFSCLVYILNRLSHSPAQAGSDCECVTHADFQLGRTYHFM